MKCRTGAAGMDTCFTVGSCNSSIYSPTQPCDYYTFTSTSYAAAVVAHWDWRIPWAVYVDNAYTNVPPRRRGSRPYGTAPAASVTGD